MKLNLTTGSPWPPQHVLPRKFFNLRESEAKHSSVSLFERKRWEWEKFLCFSMYFSLIYECFGSPDVVYKANNFRRYVEPLFMTCNVCLGRNETSTTSKGKLKACRHPRNSSSRRKRNVRLTSLSNRQEPSPAEKMRKLFHQLNFIVSLLFVFECLELGKANQILASCS